MSIKILQVNKFFYPKGGSDVLFFDTSKLLLNKGHDVIYFSMEHPRNSLSHYKKFFVSNVDLNKKIPFVSKVKIAGRIIYSFEAKNNIKRLLDYNKPDITHLHSIYHQISPAILHVLQRFNIPSVMTLHDYKLVCPSYTLFSNKKPCEKCKNGYYYNCLLNRCTKNSYSKSLLNVIEMYIHHKILNIYKFIDIFISPSIFLKDKIEEMGFKGKIAHIPNFVDVNTFTPVYKWSENSIIYFGRLSEEKGLYTLIDAVKKINSIFLKIVGEGLIRKALEEKIEKDDINNVYIMGYKSAKELKDEIKKSMFIVLPSEWYENNPLSIIEGFALGKPAIGSRIGGISELIKDNETGLTFEPGNSNDLRSKIEYLINVPYAITEMGKNARAFVEQELNVEKYYQRLMEVYNKAIFSKLHIGSNISI